MSQLKLSVRLSYLGQLSLMTWSGIRTQIILLKKQIRGCNCCTIQGIKVYQQLKRLKTNLHVAN